MVAILACCVTFCACKRNTRVSVEYITIEQFQEELALGSTFNIFIMRDDCEYCVELQAQLKNGNEGQTKKFKILEYTQENRDEIVNILEEILPNFTQIPYLGKIENGKVIEGIIDIPLNDDVWRLIE